MGNMVTMTAAPEVAAVRYEPCSAFHDDPTAPGGVCAGCGWLADEHRVDVGLAQAA